MLPGGYIYKIVSCTFQDLDSFNWIKIRKRQEAEDKGNHDILVLYKPKWK